MFLKQNFKQLQNSKLNWKSSWFLTRPYIFKKQIYEDIFIRKYVASFFFKWSKFFTYKILGSIYLFRTFGKLYITIYFFYSHLKSRSLLKRKAIVKMKKVETALIKPEVKPINKYQKHLTIMLFFYQLEKILKVQVFFKYTNICSSLLNSKLSSINMNKIFLYFLNKYSIFKYQFKEEVYWNSINFFLNWVKFKTPDASLFANYVAFVLTRVQKHTQFLFFVRQILVTLQKYFKFGGLRILISGKINGFNRSQSKQIQVGSLPRHTFQIPYSEGAATAFTTAGKLGIKVWVR